MKTNLSISPLFALNLALLLGLPASASAQDAAATPPTAADAAPTEIGTTKATEPEAEPPAAEPEAEPPAAEATPAEPAPEPTVAEATTPPAADEADLAPAFVQRPYMRRYIPENNTWELGLFGGMMFPSSDHELYAPGATPQSFNVAGVIGARVAYFPLTFLGVEVEGSGMPSQLEDGSAAGLWEARGRFIAQLPGYSFTPFLMGGVGVLGASSDEMGADSDLEWHFGIGAKLALDEHISLRLDLVDALTAKAGGSGTDGTHHPQFNIGLTFTPTRTKPDFDGDSVLDGYDRCPTETGTIQHFGCPPPDADSDSIPDADDACPELAGGKADGCPEQLYPIDTDDDGVLDRVDVCPNEAGELASAGCPAEQTPEELPPIEEPPTAEPEEASTEAPETSDVTEPASDASASEAPTGAPAD